MSSAALVRSADKTSDVLWNKQDPIKSDSEGIDGLVQLQLTDTEIMGNSYALILAGHETVSNVLQFCILELALNFSVQRRLQEEIDRICGDKPLTEWDNDIFMALLNGFAGTVINEVLRLYSPVVTIPKSTSKGSPQSLDLDGTKVTIPGGTYIALHTSAAHKSPKYWPEAKNSDVDANPGDQEIDDIEQFRPSRWLSGGLAKAEKTSSATAGKPIDLASASLLNPSTIEPSPQPESSFQSPSRFQPIRGAFLPFGEGYRTCLGRHFAQVEMMAVLAVIFRHQSVEISVCEHADDAAVDATQPGSPERRQIWSKAAKIARGRMHEGAEVHVVLKITKGSVPVRFVERGKEKFVF
jgi:hypothetical protein